MSNKYNILFLNKTNYKILNSIELVYGMLSKKGELNGNEVTLTGFFLVGGELKPLFLFFCRYDTHI